MNAREYVGNLNTMVPELDGLTQIEFYGKRIRDMYTDELEAIEDGYLDGLTVDQYSKFFHSSQLYIVHFADGDVVVYLEGDEIKAKVELND